MTTHPIITIANGASHGLSLEQLAELFQEAGKDLSSCEVGRLATDLSQMIRQHILLKEYLAKQVHLLEEAEANFVELVSKVVNLPPPLS